MKLNVSIIACLLFVTVLFPTSSQSQQTYNQIDLNELQELMTGSFSSETQSLEDSSYFHIRLCMQPIWAEKADGLWLYVEQAAYRSLETPYRQRIYQLYLTNDQQTLVSKVYELEEPLQWAGACKDEELRSSIIPEMLVERPGCELFLTREENGSFSGATLEGACLSFWRGAEWVSSHVTINKQGLTSWDRGWTQQGELIWGPESGGYRFDRISP
jgi:hypothetical protein